MSFMLNILFCIPTLYTGILGNHVGYTKIGAIYYFFKYFYRLKPRFIFAIINPTGIAMRISGKFIKLQFMYNMVGKKQF